MKKLISTLLFLAFSLAISKALGEISMASILQGIFFLRAMAIAPLPVPKSIMFKLLFKYFLA